MSGDSRNTHQTDPFALIEESLDWRQICRHISGAASADEQARLECRMAADVLARALVDELRQVWRLAGARMGPVDVEAALHSIKTRRMSRASQLRLIARAGSMNRGGRTDVGASDPTVTITQAHPSRNESAGVKIAVATTPSVNRKHTVRLMPRNSVFSKNDLRPEACLAAAGITLPSAPAPAANYVPAVRTGNLVYLAGQGPIVNGAPVMTGKVGGEVTEQEGYQAARIAAINALAVLRAEIGSLDKVRRIVKLMAWVNSAPGFTRQPFVVNGASDLMVEIFGNAGRHARSAVAANELPFNIPVEIEMIVEVARATSTRKRK